MTEQQRQKRLVKKCTKFRFRAGEAAAVSCLLKCLGTEALIQIEKCLRRKALIRKRLFLS